MSTGLGREDIRALLDDLSAELAARGARAELFLVGGAALFGIRKKSTTVPDAPFRGACHLMPAVRRARVLLGQADG
jgi:hypothetical protein